ncbi:MAG: recombinase XerD [Planctomycetes bacterium]|nr:recombinase XerD [Planctomycetota bacterium]
METSARSATSATSAVSESFVRPVATARSAIPKLRLHKASGNAAVMLDGRYLYLGKFGTREAQERYDRTIAEWLANRRRTTGAERARLDYDKAAARQRQAATQAAEIETASTVDEILAAYWEYAQGRYTREGVALRELGHLKCVMKTLRRLYGRTDASQFGPKALKLVREQFVGAGQSRIYVNQNVARIARIWKWAAAEEMVSAAAWHALQAVPGLQRGEAASDGRKIAPVADAVVDATLPYCSPEVRALVELQRLCGARSGELVIMRTGDLEMSGDVWTYRPARHKTEHRGHERVIYFGPKAQAILRPWLREALGEYVFSPARARERRYGELRAARKSPVQPSQASRKRAAPRKLPGARYTPASYAIGRRLGRNP